MKHWLVALPLLATTPGLGSPFVYNFDGVFSENFDTLSGAAGQFLVQQNGRLEFHNDNTSGEFESGEPVAHQAFQPRYDQSWTASVDVTLPLSYDAFEGGADLVEFVTGGILAAFDPSGSIPSETTRVFGPALEVNRPLLASDPRRVYSIATGRDNTSDMDPPAVEVATPLGTARVEVRFDADTKTLRALANDNELFTTTINGTGPADWGMTDSDTFRIILFGDSFNEPVDPQNPITFDNFRAAIVVPEPSGLVIVGTMLAGWRRRR